MTSLYLFLVFLGLLGGAVYLLLVFREVPGAVEERLGEWEQLPSDLGVWKVEPVSSEAATLSRETRYLWQASHGLFSSGKLVRQVRYRSLATGKIERFDPDEVLQRRRVRR